VHGTGKIMVTEAAKLNRIAGLFRIDPTTLPQASAAPAAQPASPAPSVRAPAALPAAVNAGPVMGAQDLSDDVWAEF
jgi:methyl-accepting chemotaxis protein